MKKLYLIIFVLAFTSLSAVAQSLAVYIHDNDGPYTNVRNQPKGKVVDRIPSNSSAMLDVVKNVNGWWLIFEGEYWVPDEGDKKLKGSNMGYWIHQSVIAVSTRNYGGQKLQLRKGPSQKQAATYSFEEEIMLRPIDIKDDWVKVQTLDGKHSGWIEREWLCGNSVTNCC